MTCWRCDRPILPGEPHTTMIVHTGTAVVTDVHLHVLCPAPTPPTSTWPT